ncbi:MAG: hypothetical protein GX810_04130 [Clostridiales bacterium]|nr:hypothetical protein [Clostridiales bacterium]
MSDNRTRYSSAPLHNIKRTPQRKRSVPRPPQRVGDYQDEQNAPRSFAVLQVLLMFVLPVFFIVSLLVNNNTVNLIYVLVACTALMMMWLGNAFVPNARLTLTLLHVAMVLIVLFTLWLSPAPGVNLTGTTNDLTSQFNINTETGLVGMSQRAEESQPKATTDPGSKSLVQQRLEQFMSAWIAQDYGGMVSVSLPSWVQAQDDAERKMFQIRSNRTPVDYKVTEVSGTDADSLRTVTMEASIDKSNGQEPLLFRFLVLMMRVNDVWYVDPNSLTSPQQLTPDKAAATPAVTLAPLTTASPDMLLFYNADGGTFYHLDPNCRSINQKYLPLTASFYFRDIGNATFANLKPCVYCHAPSR